MRNQFHLRGLNALCLILCSSILFSLSAYAAETDGGTLSVNFVQANVGFQLYFAAVETETGYRAADPFAECSVDFEDANAGDLRTLATTLYTCTIRDQIPPSMETWTDETGHASFSDLQAGLYLLVSPGNTAPIVVKVNAGESVTAEPKADLGPGPAPDPGSETVSVRVVKVWADSDHRSQRPETISVALFQENVLYDTITLSELNNWEYIWEALPAGYSYFVIEEAVPDHYSMSITQDEHSFVLKNTYQLTGVSEPSSPSDGGTSAAKLPQTGQLWWPVTFLAGSGLLSLLIGLVLRKDKKDEDQS